MPHGCPRTIIKAIYLILEKYHRRYGLKVHPWAKQPGNIYFSFYLDVNKPEGNTGFLLDLYNDNLSLTTYQDHVGAPAWSYGHQQEMSGWKNARTSDIIAWLERTTSFPELFTQYESKLKWWRRGYSVEQSEQYLLTWQVCGLLAVKLGSFIQTPTNLFSDYDSEWDKKRALYCSAFTRSHPEFGILSLDGISISDRGEAYICEKERLNIWDLYCQGIEPTAIADQLFSTYSSVKQ